MALIGLFAAVPAQADLSFIQVLQAQSSGGGDGVFGKSWVEIRGKSMRIVSGYARKFREGEKPQQPRRVIQIMDLGAKTRLQIYPEKKTYSSAPLGEVDYGDVPMGRRSRRGAGARWEISRSGLTLTKEASTRKLLGADCVHYRITAALELTDSSGRREKARMDQHAWVVPVSGRLSETLLDLMAFENAYRDATKGELSPLDHERYQVREVAAYLGVSEGSLLQVVMEARSRIRELPSYPVASLVAWRVSPPSDPPRESRPQPRREPATRDRPRAHKTAGLSRMRPPRPRLVVVNWRLAEQAINRIYREAAGEFRPPPSQDRPSEESPPATGDQDLYPRFEEELRKVLVDLVSEQDRLADKLPQPKELPGSAEAQEEGPAPFYEVYAELHGLEAPGWVPEQDLSVPKGYRKVPYGRLR